MKYKALICDVDGTLVPNQKHGQLSRKTIEAVARARKLIHVGVATARPYEVAYEVLERLQLSGPSILHSGAEIIDIGSGTVYRRHKFERKDVHKIYEIAKKYKERLFHNDEIERYLRIHNDALVAPILGTYIPALPEEKANVLVEKFLKIPTISSVKIPSWFEGKFDVSISPLQATKQHGILEVMEILNIYPEEVIAIGDGQNDFGMLMAAGLKIAMGNAVEDLKAIADVVAPSVEEDGVAWAIEKYVLNG